jgi:hypothetical protein
MRPNTPMRPVPMRGNGPVPPPAPVRGPDPRHDGAPRPDWRNQQAPRPNHPGQQQVPGVQHQRAPEQVPVQHTTPTRDIAPPVPPRTGQPPYTPPVSEPAEAAPRQRKPLAEMSEWEKYDHARELYAADHPELTAEEVTYRTATLEIGPDGRFIEVEEASQTQSRQDYLRNRMQQAINQNLAQRNGAEPNGGGGNVYSDLALTFEPGGELPPGYTRSMPPAALDGAPSHVDLATADLAPVFRDVQDVQQVLRQPFFRIDPGNADAIHQGEGVAPRNPGNMSINHHVSGGGQGGSGQLVSGTGYVSYSTSETHVATRTPTSIDFDEDRDVKVRDGLYKRTERITEAYHPNGISTDHTDRDNGILNASNREGEFLFPGGMGNEYVYRTWERVTYFDDKGEVTDQEIINPRVNEGFKWLTEMQEIEREMQR